jgi:hypothetical protein
MGRIATDVIGFCSVLCPRPCQSLSLRSIDGRLTKYLSGAMVE